MPSKRGDGQGGGMGAGGGLFVGEGAIVNIKDCSFQNCSSVGGAAGSSTGGGGLGGDGGGGGAFGGGGGFGGSGGGGGGGAFGGGGASGFSPGDASGANPGRNFDGGGSPSDPGVGGLGINGGAGGNGGFGGGGGNGGFGGTGGDGGFGGGGGADQGGGGGNGGFGGGGSFGGGTGGDGGFGGGGGQDFVGVGGFGGFGGGDGGFGGGGRGAGFGGAIFIQRGGDLTIEGSVFFSGSSATAGTNGSSNTDPLAGFGALGQDIFMMSGSSLTFDISSDVFLENPIEGNQGNEAPDGFVATNTQGLTKKGPALLSLTGDNTYTGTTTVEEGELRINNSVVSNIVVEEQGTLSGNFSCKVDATGNNGGNLTNHGVITPGINDVGTISVEGEFSQSATGTLVVDITPTGNNNDFIMGASAATLAGTMDVILGPGNYIAGTTYLVIDAPTNGTTFDVVTETGGLGQLVDIRVDYSSVVITIETTRLFEDQIIDSGPASDVANCIRVDDIVPNSDFALMVEALGTLSNSEVNVALSSLSAIRYGALEWINARNNSLSADILSQHLFELSCSPRDCCSCDCNANIWMTVFGNIMDNRKSLDYLSRYTANAVGALAGVDFCCGDRFYYGAAFGYTHTHLIWKNNRGSGDLNSLYGALYGSWICEYLSADLSVLGGGSDNDLDRRISFAQVDRTAKSDFWNYFVTAHMGLKSSWCCCAGVFEPFALTDYHFYTHGSFTEKGAQSLNLRVLSKDQHMMRGEAGLLWYIESDCDTYCFAPYLGLSWVGEFPLNESKQPASFTGQSCVIKALSFDSSVQLGAPQAGIKWSHCNGASFSLGYKGLFNGSTRINQFDGRFDWVF
ncbi:MAG: autotransporter domain-containing protein [Simkaniaceae bacterium]|nr:autotransporter domain-containing protein [Candidatus Sacchlamyda saccharinae]